MKVPACSFQGLEDTGSLFLIVEHTTLHVVPEPVFNGQQLLFTRGIRGPIEDNTHEFSMIYGWSEPIHGLPQLMSGQTYFASLTWTNEAGEELS